jgi:hypothetical protein
LRSILDFVAAEARDLHRGLSAADQRKLDEYLSGLRELEHRIAGFDGPPPQVPDRDLPARPTAAACSITRWWSTRAVSRTVIATTTTTCR